MPPGEKRGLDMSGGQGRVGGEEVRQIVIQDFLPFWGSVGGGVT